MTTVSQVSGKELAERWISRRGRRRPQRDFAAMEQRRMRAVDLFEQGVIPAEIARQVGVSHQSVSDWRRAWRQSGREALRGAGRAGRRPKLSRDQLAEIEAALANGAEANGYTTNLWTLPRVAEVIERMSGVAYHPGHVWYLLHDLLGWTWQRPARRAVERNDEAIEHWVKQRWPHLKKGHGARTH
jgi:transposase